MSIIVLLKTDYKHANQIRCCVTIVITYESLYWRMTNPFYYWQNWSLVYPHVCTCVDAYVYDY